MVKYGKGMKNDIHEKSVRFTGSVFIEIGKEILTD